MPTLRCDEVQNVDLEAGVIFMIQVPKTLYHYSNRFDCVFCLGFLGL